MRSNIGIVAIAALALGAAACAGGEERREEERPEAQEAPEQQAPAQEQEQQEGQMQPQTRAGQPPPPLVPDRQYRASPHLAVVDSGLVTASANARLLDRLAADPRSYDPSAARTLYDNAAQGVTEAQEALRKLQPLAQNEEERQSLEQVGLRLGRAEATLNRIENQLTNRDQVAEEAARLHSDLRAAVAPLRDVAQAMNVTFDVVGAG